MAKLPTIDQLPCAPQILLLILDDLQRESDTAEFTRLARQDPIITSRILGAASANSKPVTGIEQAIERLGAEQLDTLVFTHSIRQTQAISYEPYIKLWEQALRCAWLARDLASLSGYYAPEEAYLAGLLANVGQFILLQEYGSTYGNIVINSSDCRALRASEQALFGSNHCDIGADLLEGWRMSHFLSDAIRYQHEATERIRDAHLLVKAVHAANLAIGSNALSKNIIQKIDGLFDIGESCVRELLARNIVDFNNLASSLKLSTQEAFTHSQTQLSARLAELSELSQLSNRILQTDTVDALIATTQQCLSISFGIGRAVMFRYDEAYNQLTSFQLEGREHADFRLKPEPGRSLIGDALLQAKPVDSGGSAPLAVIDRQLLHYCRGELLICWPLLFRGKSLGVLVFAGNHHQWVERQQHNRSLKDLVRVIAQSLAGHLHQTQQKGNGQHSALIYQQKIREAVHEAGNPLSIIRNYLEMLRLKLGPDHEAHENLGLIAQEIDRVAEILKDLRDDELTPATAQKSTMNVNRVIEETVQLLQDSISISKNLTIQLHLYTLLEDVLGNHNHFKQVMTNLLKNAAESLGDGGNIAVGSYATTGMNGLEYITITVADNGTGIPEQTMKHLFSPVQSSKGSEHAGLGLSIVKKLVEGMNGNIICRTGEHGTEFQISLPKIAII